MGMSDRKSVQYKCAWCGKPDEVYQSEYDARLANSKSKKVFCSHRCSAAHHSDLWKRLREGHGTQV